MTDIKKLHLKTVEVSELTGLPVYRVLLIAQKHLTVPRYVNGDYKFTNDHIEKIKEIDAMLRVKVKGRPKNKIKKKDVAAIQKKIKFIGAYVNKQLLKLSKELAMATAED
jgi:DNA-binding transcriptional MerR regulator